MACNLFGRAAPDENAVQKSLGEALPEIVHKKCCLFARDLQNGICSSLPPS